MDDSTKILIAIGASVASNCEPCLAYHISKAREAGTDDSEVRTAIDVAKAVRNGAMKTMDGILSRTMSGEKAATGSGEKGCGCG